MLPKSTLHEFRRWPKLNRIIILEGYSYRGLIEQPSTHTTEGGGSGVEEQLAAV